ncbi:ornithine carbamoyltransferase [Patulibacter brassicae]|uniref:Ornithine carbamoyltransferase n=1 Tax=Patulibacter brassicae TaxID=1705717 RepID=A0ABU4VKA6_9ACTN|nr:ornithine carbamoyltransferase [Patulibacter brassicae]MDX8152276.1 ornithine carbamoyltransferase [Patulibacter brassicae]
MTRHLLTGTELTRSDLLAVLRRAAALKADPALGRDSLAGRSVALIFQKPSTRTRISMEVGISELGAHPLLLRPDEMQLSRGESVKDTARILSRHVHAVGIRTNADALLEELADEGAIPVINLLTDGHHPCQVVADLLTLQEAFPERLGADGGFEDLHLAYVGDGNNVARSIALVGAIAGLRVTVVAPDGYQLDPDETTATLASDPRTGVAGADCLYADVWVSMGDTDSDARRTALAPYQVDDALLDAAAPGAIALHCLPAHPGEEITADVLYGDRQRIWDQAENRRHAQKALLEWALQAGPFAAEPAGAGSAVG